MPGDDIENKSLIKNKHSYIIHCNAHNEDVHMCGIGFILPKDAEKKIYTSFNAYDQIILKARTQSSNSNTDNRIRVTIRSLYDKNPQAELSRMSKYQRIRFNVGEYLQASPNDFSVDSWWLDQYKIPFEQSKLDFSRVLAISVYANEIPIKNKGVYSVEVDELKILCKIIPTTYLKPVMFILWPLLIFTCLIHILWFYRRSGILLKKKLYIDRESGFYNEKSMGGTSKTIRL